MVSGTFPIENETTEVAAVSFAIETWSLRTLGIGLKPCLWELVGFYGALFRFWAMAMCTIPRLEMVRVKLKNVASESE